MILSNGFLVDYKSKVIEKKDMRIESGKIIEIEDQILPVENERVIDLAGKYMVPSFFDMHVHFREPGLSYKETIYDGSRAAAKAGYTGVCMMPNTKPIVDSQEVIDELKTLIARDAILETRIVGAITKGEKGKELADFAMYKKNHVIALSDDGVNVDSSEILREALAKAKPLELPLLLHCEDMTYRQGCIHQGLVAEMFGLEGIPSHTEYRIIAENIELAKNENSALHICHISCKESVDIIRKAKSENIKISCEVTPNHLILDESAFIKSKNKAKINPPLRSLEDKKALVEGLVDGTIDVIATDHAPHSQEEKARDFKEAPFGMSSIDIAPQLIYTNFVKTNQISLFDMIRVLSISPREILGLKPSFNQVGDQADIAVLDLENAFEVCEEDWISKGKNTVFFGEKLYGKNKLTLLNGQIIYEGEI